jgi:hypothetical protein
MVTEPIASGMPRAARGLTRRVLAEPGLQHAAEDHLFDVGRRHAGARNRLLDRERAQLRSTHRRERALELADRGAARADDDGFQHGALPRRVKGRGC